MIAWLTQPFASPHTVLLFRKLVYLFLLVYHLAALPHAELFWGPFSYFPPADDSPIGGHSPLVNALSRPPLQGLYPIFVTGLLVFCVTGLLGRAPLLSGVVVYLCFVNLVNKSHLINTGGDVLLAQLLLLQLPIRCARPPELSSPGGGLRNTLNNTFFAALRLQLVILYLVTVWWKWFDYHWYQGEAVGYIVQLDSYSLGVLREAVRSAPVLGVLGTYAAILYQALFPILVWVRAARGWLLAAGVAFHGGIALGMGIFYFSAVVILAYTLFLEEETARRWNRRLSLAGWRGE